MIDLAATDIVNRAASSSGFGPAQWSTIIAALIAALVAVTGYMLTQAQARRERRAREFADALAAVEEYLEALYRIRRRQAATPEAREALTSALSDLQARIALHRAWLQVEAPAVGHAYEALVSAARSEVGAQTAEAWNAAPLTSDTDMNLKVAYPHPDSDAERAKVIAAMRQHLRLRPALQHSAARFGLPLIRVLPVSRGSWFRKLVCRSRKPVCSPCRNLSCRTTTGNRRLRP